MKKLFPLLIILFCFLGCRKDYVVVETNQNSHIQYHETINCTIEFPDSTNTNDIGIVTIFTAGDAQELDLAGSNKKSRGEDNSFDTEVTIGKNTVTIGSVTNEQDQPIAFCAYVPGENSNTVLFNATETAVALVFMHPFLSDYDIESAVVIKNKIKQSPNFLPLLNEVLDRSIKGSLNLDGQDFDPNSFANFGKVVTDVMKSTYDNTAANQDGIKIVEVEQDNEYVTFKIENYRKRWLKVTPSLYTNGDTAKSNFHSDLLNIEYPWTYVPSIKVNLLKQVFKNANLFELHSTSNKLKVKKKNAEKLYLDIYGNGLDQYGHISEELINNHIDVVIISSLNDLVLPFIQMFTGISDLEKTLAKEGKIIVGRPHDDPYNKFLERLIAHMNKAAFKAKLKTFVAHKEQLGAIKFTAHETIKFIISDIGNHPQDLYAVLKDQFGEQAVKAKKEDFKQGMNGFNRVTKILSVASSVTNFFAGINTILYSDWHNQKRITLTLHPSPTVQTDPVIANLTAISATVSGNIVDDHGSPVIASGVCWSTISFPKPTLSNTQNFTTDGNPTGIFNSNLTGLLPNTTYHARAYATSLDGTGYGDMVSFTTNNNTSNTNWTKVSCGVNHSLAIKSNGTLWAWGSNLSGLLGDGTNNNANTPIQIGNSSDWKEISAGGDHSLAIKTNGTLWAWSQNWSGQLGDGTNSNKNIPTQIGNSTDWNKISAGGSGHSLAIKTNGTAWAWGNNSYGQLGDGTNSNKNIPTQIGNSTDWNEISAAGVYHSIAIKTNGTLWAWGKNTNGQLGDGTNSNKNIPTQIGNSTDWNEISVGGEYSIGIKTNGTLWAWGINSYGQLGDGTNSDKNIPTQIGNSTDWNEISAKNQHSLAVKINGTSWAWGKNVNGQLGNGTNSDKNIPTQIGNSTDWNEISAGGFHSLAIKTNGDLWAWGYNLYGQLGDGNNTNSNVPIKVN